MKTERIARGGLDQDADAGKTGEWVELHHAAGNFFIKYGMNKLRKISSREALKTFLHFINNGEADSSDLTPLINAVNRIGHELPFTKGFITPWRN